MTDLATPPLWLNNLGYTARLDRRLIEATFGGEGVLGGLDLKCSTDGSSLAINTKVGEAIIRGDAHSDDALYYINSTTESNLATTTTTNPKIVCVVARIYDNDEAGGAYDKATIELLEGTSDAAATLDNRTGAPTIPNSCLLLADVLVPASPATAIPIANTRDRRAFVAPGLIPQIVTNLTTDVVSFIGHSGNSPQYIASSLAHASHDTKQIVGLQYLPRRIESATRIKFKLTHSATALAGNYVVSICDASGRPFVSSGTTGLSGSANQSVVQSATITATTFDAGLYYVFLGLDTSAGTADCFGYSPYSASMPNMIFYATTGSLVVPTTILGMTDATATGVTPAILNALPVLPQMALSVG